LGGVSCQVYKYSAQEFCIVSQCSRARSCEKEMVGGPLAGAPEWIQVGL